MASSYHIGHWKSEGIRSTVFGMVCKSFTGQWQLSPVPSPYSSLGTYPEDDHSYLSPLPKGPYVLACFICVLIVYIFVSYILSLLNLLWTPINLVSYAPMWLLKSLLSPRASVHFLFSLPLQFVYSLTKHLTCWLAICFLSIILNLIFPLKLSESKFQNYYLW